ncbi:hypothetical protein ACAG39_11775 [Caldicellulosiruptoraceae bacterium PP1]
MTSMKVNLYDIATILRKEYWEIKKGTKNIIICFSLVLIMPLVIKLYSERSIIPINLFFLLIPIFVSLGTSGQISMYTIWEEKKANTIEYLLSTRISKYIIITGKALLPTIIGYILSLFSLLILIITSYKTFHLYSGEMNLSYFIILFIITFMASLITIFIQIYLKGERFTPTFSFIAFSAFILIIWYLHFKLYISVYLIIVLCIIISILLVWLCGISLSKYNFS